MPPAPRPNLRPPSLGNPISQLAHPPPPLTTDQATLRCQFKLQKLKIRAINLLGRKRFPQHKDERPSIQLPSAHGGADRYPTWALYPPSTPTRPAKRSTEHTSPLLSSTSNRKAASAAAQPSLLPKQHTSQEGNQPPPARKHGVLVLQHPHKHHLPHHKPSALSLRIRGRRRHRRRHTRLPRSAAVLHRERPPAAQLAPARPKGAPAGAHHPAELRASGVPVWCRTAARGQPGRAEQPVGPEPRRG